MKKLYALTLACTILSAADYGIVNFATCLNDSKKGKQEQAGFENMKKQVGAMMEETEKQLNDLSQKLNDPEYMDGLSPEAEDDLKNKFATLSEEMNRYQGQYYQVVQQAYMRVNQQVGQEVASASEKVAKDKKLNMVINKDACFYYNANLDVTNAVIQEMDKRFDSIQKPASDGSK